MIIQNKNNCMLHLFLIKIFNYEPEIINIIKSFMKPYDYQYKFKIGEKTLQILFYLCNHTHTIKWYNKINNKINYNYCSCYFNRKNNNYPLKKQKSYRVIKIKSLEYNYDTFEKEYIFYYGINFSLECRTSEITLIPFNLNLLTS